MAAERDAAEAGWSEERRLMTEELRQLKAGKFVEAEAVVQQATAEKQAAFTELQTVQKQRQAEAEHATRQTKIAINTLRREKDTLAEQVGGTTALH